ncbi:MAG TPA: exonuclease subunit SbcD, partial [Verrucomicrobiales bacterium]|nr:exonuclease subunit SbcD [Verrucomicrobiales bacterium]
MPAFTVIHTADWHLGVRLRELDRVAEHEAFLAWLTDTIEQEAADLLVIAGDVFDSANPPESARRMWYNFLDGLHRRCPRCSVVAVAGNHDSPHVLESTASLLSGIGVHVTGEMPADAAQCLRVFPDKSGTPALILAAVPLLRDRDLRRGGDDSTASDIQTQLREGIRLRYAAVEEEAKRLKESHGCAVLATGHLTVSGSSHSESERDIHVGNLGAVNETVFGSTFDYLALGHLHRPQHTGGGRVRYSGSPIALSFSEWQDAKEVRVL